MIWRRAAVLLAAFGTVVAVATPSSADTTIPYTYVDNRIVVECRLDGQGPATMIVDTGSPSIAVTPETAAKLAIAVHAAGTVTGAGNNAAKNGRAKIATSSRGRASISPSGTLSFRRDPSRVESASG